MKVRAVVAGQVVGRAQDRHAPRDGNQGVAIARTDEPMRSLLALRRGLQAAHDPRAATALAQARAELAQRAERLLDPAQRQRFLHAVACHREILEGAGSAP